MTSSSRSRTFASKLREQCSLSIVVTVLDSHRLDVTTSSPPPPPSPPFCFRFEERRGLLTRTSLASQSQMSFRIYSIIGADHGFILTLSPPIPLRLYTLPSRSNLHFKFLTLGNDRACLFIGCLPICHPANMLTPSTPAVPNCCCSMRPVPYWSNRPFLISDIRALWRSVLIARAPECQKLKIVG